MKYFFRLFRAFFLKGINTMRLRGYMHLRSFVYNFFMMLSKTWFILVMLLAGFYALLLNDQGIDAMRGSIQTNSDYFSFSFGLGFWMFYAWFTGRMALHFYALKSVHMANQLSGIEKLLPRIYAVVPMVLVNLSYFLYNSAFGLWNGVFLNMVPVLVLLYIYFREKIIDWFRSFVIMRISSWLAQKIRYTPINVSQAIRVKQLGWNERVFMWLPLALLLIFILIFYSSPVHPQLFQPLVLLVWALAVWTGVFTWFIYFESRTRIPVFVFLFIWMFIASYFNDNHRIPLVGDEHIVFNAMPDVDTAFLRWCKANQVKTIKQDTMMVNGQVVKRKPKVLYMIAGQGGGIRAGYWMYESMDALHKSITNFDDKLFAMSTVSGSSLGAGLYLIQAAGAHNPGVHDSINRFFEESDLLSPVLGSFFFNDMTQRFLPFSIEEFDRGRAFERGIEINWQKYLREKEENLFDKGMLELYSQHQRLPAMFFNSTHVETGQRIIISNLRLDTTDYYQFFKLAKKDVRLSTALSLSARFPAITPAGTLYANDNYMWGHMNDGGYHENSGVETLRQLYHIIRKRILKQELNVKVVVVYIKNGQESVERKASKGSHETKAVTGSFFNSWALLPQNNVNTFARELALSNDKLYEIALKRADNDNLPLGWFLSAKARKIMKNCLDDLRLENNFKNIVKESVRDEERGKKYIKL